MNRGTFLDSFGDIADAPGGIDKLRRLVLDLALHGSLTFREPGDLPASVFMDAVRAERDSWVSAKKIRRPAAQPPVVDAPAPPTGWLWVRLGDLVTFEYGKNLPAAARSGGDIPVFGANGIVGWHSLALVAEPSVIVGRKGSAGAVNVAATGSWPTDVTYYVRPPAGMPVPFVEMLLRSLDLPSLARGIKPGLDRVEAYALPVLVPPLAEQDRIVERVDELMAQCDEMEKQQAARVEARSALTAASLHHLADADTADDLRAAIASFADRSDLHLAPGDGDIEALKRLRQTILDLAVRGRLTHQDPADLPAAVLLDQIASERDRLIRAKEIRKTKKFDEVTASLGDADLPSGWAWARANEFFIASDSGWSPQCMVESAGPGDWGVLKTSAVSRGVFDPDENKKLPRTLEPRPKLEVQPGEFVMIRASGSKSLVGRGAIVTETESRLMLSDKHIRLTFLHEASTRFWAILNESTAVQAYYADESSGTSTMSNVTRDRIGAMRVAVPPLAEQLRIVESVDQLLGLCDDLEQQFRAAMTLRGKLSDSVVAHAVPTAIEEVA